MVGLFSTPKFPALEQTAAPSADDPAIEAARRRELEARQKAKGRIATVLTGNQGDQPPTRLSKAVLLSGTQ